VEHDARSLLLEPPEGFGWHDTARFGLLAILVSDPFPPPPPFEKLVGDLRGACSRRISIQHRLVCQVLVDEHVVKVLRMWTHYE
jgi:Txe/YoeB family toxin of toxin-antitoxin system